MNQTLYDLMDWREVEEIVYSESANPHAILGPHLKKGGLLVQAFLPGAEKAEAVPADTGDPVEMDLEDDAGFFACLLPERRPVPYQLRVQWKDGKEELLEDPYAFPPTVEESSLKKFAAGNAADVYDWMGSKPMEIRGVAGVCFTVWTPRAMRVSVVGNFNGWDGRRHQMRKVDECGVFQIFIPGVQPGELYKYEIKGADRKVFMKADPYARAAELRPGTASIVPGADSFCWTDEAWMEARQENTFAQAPVSIFQVNAAAWNGGRTYTELAEELSEFAVKMNYTHVQLMPVMEHPLDDSLGYQCTGFYAPTSRYGTPEEFRSLVNTLHRKGIGVIMEWPCARFPKDAFGPAYFDGAALYEYADSQGDTAVFNFERPEVRNFLTANALFWAEEYHLDGLLAIDMASILYYGRAGQNRRNMYGGGENLEGAAFLRELTALMKERCPGFLLFADGSAEWPQTTGSPEEGGLGFHFRKNNGWSGSVLHYAAAAPWDRSARYEDITNPMLYQYSENFVLPMPLGEMLPEAGARRDLAGYFYTHPGKKLTGGASPEKTTLLKDLNAFYLSHPALWEKDGDPEGFEWINFHSWKENVIAFLRKSSSDAERLLVVLNFSDDVYPEFNIGVPFRGSYREVFSTDRKEYGGTGFLNTRTLFSQQMDVDLRSDGITVKLPAHAALIFSCKRKGAVPGEKKAADTDDLKRVAVTPKKPARKPAVTETAKEQVVKAAAAAKKRAGEVAEAGKKRAGEVAEAGKKRAGEVAEAGKKRAGEVAEAGKRAVKTAQNAAQTAAQTAAEKVNALRGKDKENNLND
ncbi:MAG: alpha amylase C-terminal domain-containing protein [Stomatobaculum sp.]|nr:alpha amylase C-terminal domain-containing protein [Stomatobaculum sp.]